MKPFKVLSAPEQVAEHLRNELLQRRWQGTMPGEDRLIAELGIGRHTVKAALRQLEEEGLLEGRGPGHPRRIVLSEDSPKPDMFRIRILCYERGDQGLSESTELIARLQQDGFTARFAQKSLMDLKMDVSRVARYVASTPADAWIVWSASREVLDWFSRRPEPAFALYGVKSGLSIASSAVRKDPALVIRRLVELGHHSIVMLAREERLQPKPAFYEQTFLDALESHGIATSSYHLPVWGNTPAEFHQCLDSIFRYTPPTALLLGEAMLFNAGRDHLAQRGITAPRDVSLICDDPDISFSWCDPEVAHFSWDFAPIERRILRWANHVARGREDRHQSVVKSEFVEGGMIGPVPE